jgi:hypothetical protein
MLIISPANAFKRLLLPTFGRPIIATVGSAIFPIDYFLSSIYHLLCIRVNVQVFKVMNCCCPGGRTYADESTRVFEAGSGWGGCDGGARVRGRSKERTEKGRIQGPEGDTEVAGI